MRWYLIHTSYRPVLGGIPFPEFLRYHNQWYLKSSNFPTEEQIKDAGTQKGLVIQSIHAITKLPANYRNFGDDLTTITDDEVTA